MPQVYTSKVVIQGEQIDAYFEALQEAEGLRAPFRSRLNGLNTEFGNYLATKYSKRTVAKHTSIVELFIDFVCDYTDVLAIEEITKGMVNSQFRRWYKKLFNIQFWSAWLDSGQQDRAVQPELLVSPLLQFRQGGAAWRHDYRIRQT